MAQLIIIASIVVVAILLAIFSRKGWIKLPEDSRVLQIWLLCGIPILLVSLGFLLGVYAEIAEKGMQRFITCYGPVLIVGIVGSLVGYSFFKKRQKDRTDFQKIDLSD